MAKGKRIHGRLSIFKGREAKLNYVVFQVLSLKGPQTIYDIRKQLKNLKGFRKVRYATVNKRVRTLQEKGYLKKAGVKKTKAGTEATIYEPTTKAYLAVLLNQIKLNQFLEEAEEEALLLILATILSTTKPS